MGKNHIPILGYYSKEETNLGYGILYVWDIDGIRIVLYNVGEKNNKQPIWEW